MSYSGNLVGYLIAARDHDLLDILRLGVHPDYRRLWIGSELLGAAGTGSMMLTVRKSNTVAIRFYAKHGFHIVGHLRDVGAWLMLREAL